MRELLKNYKTKLDPTDKQKILINKTIGVCRYIYNIYLSHNRKVYEKEDRFVTSEEFSKWCNCKYISEQISK